MHAMGNGMCSLTALASFSVIIIVFNLSSKFLIVI